MESRWEGILASIFKWILVDFWRQVGRENGAKIDPRRHRKSDEKMEGTKMATRCEEVALRTRDPRGPEPWGGGRGRG